MSFYGLRMYHLVSYCLFYYYGPLEMLLLSYPFVVCVYVGFCDGKNTTGYSLQTTLNLMRYQTTCTLATFHNDVSYLFNQHILKLWILWCWMRASFTKRTMRCWIWCFIVSFKFDLTMHILIKSFRPFLRSRHHLLLLISIFSSTIFLTGFNYIFWMLLLTTSSNNPN